MDSESKTPGCEHMVRAHHLCSALNSIMVLMNSLHDFEEILKRIVVDTATTIGSESARIAMREGERWVIRYIHRLPQDLLGRSFSDEDLPHAALAMITRKPVAIDNALEDDRTNTDVMKFYGIRSVLVIPVMELDKVVGALFFNYHSHQVRFTESEIDYAEKVSVGLALALRNAHLYRQAANAERDIDEANRLSDALSEIDRTIYSTLDTDEIFQRVLHQATDSIGAETAMLFTRQQGAWTVRYVYRMSQGLVGRTYSDDDVRHTAITAQTGQPLACPDAFNDERVHPGFVRSLQIRALLDFPLLIRGEVIGDLVFHYHSGPHEFSQHQINFVRKLQYSLSLALHNALLFEAQKESETRLKQAEKIGRTGHFHFDLRTGAMSWSEGLFHILGRDPARGEPDPEEFLRTCVVEPAFEEVREKIVRDEPSQFDATIRSPECEIELHVVVDSLKDAQGTTLARLGTVQDISERTRNQRFKQWILDSLPAHIAVIDRDANIIDINGPWLNFAAENGIGANDTGKIGPGIDYLAVCAKASSEGSPLAQEALQGIEAVLRMERDEFTLEYPCDSPSEKRWFVMKVARPSHDFEGAVIAHMDITSLKLAEEALRASEQRFAAFMSHLPAPAWMKDLEGRYVFANAEALRVYGLSQQELTGKRDDEVFSPDTAHRFVENDRRVLAGGESLQDTETLLHPDGIEHHSIVSKFAVPGADGTPAYVAGVAFDITRRKIAEEERERLLVQLDAVLESITEGVIIADLHFNVINMNPAALSILGFANVEQVRQQLSHFQEIFEVNDLDGNPVEFERWALPRAIHGERYSDYELQVRRKDTGHTITASFSGTPVRTRSGDVILAVATVRDITEHKRDELEIIRLNKELSARAADLENANADLEAFNYSASHDLRQPLNIISGYSQAIQLHCADKLCGECVDSLQKIYANGMRMNSQIEALLNFSRVSRYGIRRETVNLSEIARSVMDQLRAAETGRPVEIRIAEGITADGDPNLLRSVLENLVGNAWKYTRDQERPVIEFGAGKHDGETVYFVRDNGQGFRMTDVDKLFVPFQRLPGAERHKGHGIGLATVDKIIKRHGGRIWAEGTPGKEAVFSFTLGPVERRT